MINYFLIAVRLFDFCRNNYFWRFFDLQYRVTSLSCTFWVGILRNDVSTFDSYPLIRFIWVLFSYKIINSFNFHIPSSSLLYECLFYTVIKNTGFLNLKISWNRFNWKYSHLMKTLERLSISIFLEVIWSILRYISILLWMRLLFALLAANQGISSRKPTNKEVLWVYYQLFLPRIYNLYFDRLSGTQ